MKTAAAQPDPEFAALAKQMAAEHPGATSGPRADADAALAIEPGSAITEPQSAADAALDAEVGALMRDLLTDAFKGDADKARAWLLGMVTPARANSSASKIAHRRTGQLTRNLVVAAEA